MPAMTPGRRRAPCRVGPRHDGEELVAAQPADRDAVGHSAAIATRDVAEHTIARLVAERVVDFLESVEVDEQDRRVVEPPACDKPLHQRGPVRQAGERVDTGPVLELRLECTLFGDVAEVQDQRTVVPAGQRAVRAALLVELVGEVPLARDVVGERERVVGTRDVLGRSGTEHVTDAEADARTPAPAPRGARSRG